MHSDDGEVLLGMKRIAEELSRLTGEEVPEGKAKHWCAKSYIPAWKTGLSGQAPRPRCARNFASRVSPHNHRRLRMGSAGGDNEVILSADAR
jgi:hypothetical protein